jgi:hypothetical protein
MMASRKAVLSPNNIMPLTASKGPISFQRSPNWTTSPPSVVAICNEK